MVSAAAGAAGKIPTTPAGKRMREVINLFNKADRLAWKEYIKSNFTSDYLKARTMKQYGDIFSWVCHNWGTFEFKEVIKSENHLIAARLFAPVTEYWLEMVVRTDQTSPFKISRVNVRPRMPEHAKPSKKMADEDIARELKLYLDKLDKHDKFSGTVLLAKNGKVLFKGAYGLASKRFNIPNRIDTKFNLGSMNKMFTSVAIAQLVEKGKLSYEDTLDKYLDAGWLKPEMTRQIKIKHLLTHTSGLGSYFNKTFMESSRLRFRKLDDYKILIKDEIFRFEPGKKQGYSNTGMFLLGVVIEKLTGQSYFDYIRENISKPAGMVNSDCYAMDRPVPNLAIGYEKVYDDKGDYWRNNIYDHVLKGGPAGGGFSTVEDLLRFALALEQNKLISKESADLVMSAKPELKSPGYGYGFSIIKKGEETIVGHDGGFTGINSILNIFRKSGYVYAILSNYSDGMETVRAKLNMMLTAGFEPSAGR
jgi:CubicO group peptidase (beta-lactamase class C family)